MKHKDANKSFIVKALMKIPYFQNIPKKAFSQLLHSVKRYLMEDGYNFIKPGDLSNELYIIEFGNVEIYTYFEGNKFVLEYLSSGSIINYRAFLMNDIMQVYMKCLSNVKMI